MVAVKAHEADRYAASPPERIRLFLVYGNDSGAVTERARKLEQLALTRGAGESVLRFGSDELSSNPGRVVDEATSASLFGGEPVIALRVLDGRHNVIGALQPLFDRPPDAAWLVVEAGELGPSSPLRKAFEGSKSAAALPAYQLEGGGLSTFLHDAAADAGVTLEPQAFELLVESLGGDRLAIRGELEKLFLYLGDRKIAAVADVEAVVGDTTGARTDEVVDSALLGESEALEAGLGRLRAEGGSAAALGALTLRHLLQLQTLRAAVDAGMAPSRAVESARPPIFGRRRPMVESELMRWPSAHLMEARRRIDRAVAMTRLTPALEDAAISESLHQLALTARRLKRGG